MTMNSLELVMALAQLIYISRRKQNLSRDELDAIVEKSQRRNAQRDITGVLMCGGLNLMQLLEGELADVVNLFETIRLDPRHENIRCLFCKNISRRLFPEWGMAMADLENKSLIDRHRLTRLLEDVRASNDTQQLAVEARVVLHDFKSQLRAAA